ncbi:small ribosomal subunit protein mS26 [Prorops nasuta]|uniref:small ribosomal subunit protein mS26 n=1 Tax=Prorops nasuta TaxID=863751 RepID=UPI0034CD2160
MIPVIKTIGFSVLTMCRSGTCTKIIPTTVFKHSIRWRKPIWLPTAKSKMFRIPVRPDIPTEEFEEIKRLYNNYNTYMKSIRKYMGAREREMEVELDLEAINKVEEEDFAHCKAINDEWNNSIVLIRNERVAKASEQQKEQILQKLIEKEKRDAQIREKVLERLETVKEDAVTFITAENIDQAIEEALSNVIDHNAAIDSLGNFYTGESSIELRKEKELQQ